MPRGKKNKGNAGSAPAPNNTKAKSPPETKVTESPTPVAAAVVPTVADTSNEDLKARLVNAKERLHLLQEVIGGIGDPTDVQNFSASGIDAAKEKLNIIQDSVNSVKTTLLEVRQETSRSVTPEGSQSGTNKRKKNKKHQNQNPPQGFVAREQVATDVAETKSKPDASENDGSGQEQDDGTTTISKKKRNRNRKKKGQQEENTASESQPQGSNVTDKTDAVKAVKVEVPKTETKENTPEANSSKNNKKNNKKGQQVSPNEKVECGSTAPAEAKPAELSKPTTDEVKPNNQPPSNDKNKNKNKNKNKKAEDEDTKKLSEPAEDQKNKSKSQGQANIIESKADNAVKEVAQDKPTPLITKEETPPQKDTQIKAENVNAKNQQSKVKNDQKKNQTVPTAAISKTSEEEQNVVTTTEPQKLDSPKNKKDNKKGQAADSKQPPCSAEVKPTEAKVIDVTSTVAPLKEGAKTIDTQSVKVEAPKTEKDKNEGQAAKTEVKLEKATVVSVEEKNVSDSCQSQSQKNKKNKQHVPAKTAEKPIESAALEQTPKPDTDKISGEQIVALVSEDTSKVSSDTVIQKEEPNNLIKSQEKEVCVEEKLSSVQTECKPVIDNNKEILKTNESTPTTSAETAGKTEIPLNLVNIPSFPKLDFSQVVKDNKDKIPLMEIKPSATEAIVDTKPAEAAIKPVSETTKTDEPLVDAIKAMQDSTAPKTLVTSTASKAETIHPPTQDVQPTLEMIAIPSSGADTVEPKVNQPVPNEAAASPKQNKAKTPELKGNQPNVKNEQKKPQQGKGQNVKQKQNDQKSQGNKKEEVKSNESSKAEAEFKTLPQEVTPEKVVPEKVAPGKSVPEKVPETAVSEKVVPEKATPHKTTPEKITEKAASEKVVPEKEAHKKSTSEKVTEKTASQKVAPQKSTSEKILVKEASEKLISEKESPKKSTQVKTSEKASPEKVVPEKVTPQKSATEKITEKVSPEKVVPVKEAPKKSTPEKISEKSASEKVIPEKEAPKKSAPEKISEKVAPENVAPEKLDTKLDSPSTEKKLKAEQAKQKTDELKKVDTTDKQEPIIPDKPDKDVPIVDIKTKASNEPQVKSGKTESSTAQSTSTKPQPQKQELKPEMSKKDLKKQNKMKGKAPQPPDIPMDMSLLSASMIDPLTTDEAISHEESEDQSSLITSDPKNAEGSDFVQSVDSLLKAVTEEAKSLEPPKNESRVTDAERAAKNTSPTSSKRNKDMANLKESIEMQETKRQELPEKSAQQKLEPVQFPAVKLMDILEAKMTSPAVKPGNVAGNVRKLPKDTKRTDQPQKSRSKSPKDNKKEATQNLKTDVGAQIKPTNKEKEVKAPTNVDANLSESKTTSGTSSITTAVSETEQVGNLKEADVISKQNAEPLPNTATISETKLQQSTAVDGKTGTVVGGKNETKPKIAPKPNVPSKTAPKVADRSKKSPVKTSENKTAGKESPTKEPTTPSKTTTQAKPTAQPTQAKPTAQPTQSKPTGQPTQAKPAPQATQAKPTPQSKSSAKPSPQTKAPPQPTTAATSQKTSSPQATETQSAKKPDVPPKPNLPKECPKKVPPPPIPDEDEEFVEYKFTPRPVFISTACQICKVPLDIPNPCKLCQMVSYCSDEHEKEDQMAHGPLCSAIQEIAKKRGGHIYNNARILNDDDYRSLRVHTLNLCENFLKRHLLPFEREILLFPRLCCTGSCREWRQQLLIECKQCGQVSYCAAHPDHLPQHHENWCNSFNLYQKIVLRQKNFGRIEPSLPSKIMQKQFDLSDNIDNVFKILYKNYGSIKDECIYATLTQLATAPLTALYGAQKNQQEIGEVYTIHLVGSELQFEADTLDKWETFFLHLVPNLMECRVVFVGPELNAENLPLEILSRIRMCRTCRQNCRIVKFDFQCGILYHDYANSPAFTKPDLICFFNPGLYRSTGFNGLDTWPNTIKSATSMNCPIVVTSYTEVESPRDLDRIQKESERPLSLVQPPHINPFASQRPERNFISDEVAPMIFKNFFCFCVK